MDRKHRILLLLLIVFIAGIALTGVFVDGFGNTFKGFFLLQAAPARLINDFFETAGIGGTLLNSAVCGSIALGFIMILGIKLSGPTYAAVLTIMGFALFGKTPVNIIPILFGVYLAAKTAGKEYREYAIIALFGTALGPIVSLLIVEMGLTGIPSILLGLGAGTGAGFLLPAIAVTMLHLHQGYNLYNMGLSCGFLALFAASLFKAAGYDFAGELLWYDAASPVLTLLVPLFSLLLITTGIIIEVREIRTQKSLTLLTNLKEIYHASGRLPSDFMDLGSLGSSLFNSGLIGLAGSLFVFAVGGDYNGPVIGGLLTIMGFAAFGTHLKNWAPVLLGIVIASLLFGKELNAPGPILAALFGSTLGPIAGQFGPLIGIAAGFIHLTMVLQTGAWQGGINLYNNGFAGGMTAALLIALIQWWKTNKKDL